MRHRLLAAVAAGTLAVSLVACSNGSSTGTSPASSGSAMSKTTEKVTVVASTNVWGSVAKVVAGDMAEVTPIITKPSQDPHDYEATAQDKLVFSKAKIAIVNGGGYDDWATKLATTSASKPTLIDAVETSGLKKDGEADFNEHVFYSMATARKVAEVVATDLGKADPANAAKYTENAKSFGTTMDTLIAKAKKIGAAHAGATAVATEPVVGYLLADMGIKNITPDEFVEQSETDAGPSTKVVDETTKLLTDKKASVLLVNAQTTDDVSKRLVAAAEKAKVPTVGTHETFPEGVTTYDDFVGKTIDAIGAALK